MLDPDLYRAILNRVSVRRYSGQHLAPDALSRVQQVIAETVPLVTTNSFGVALHSGAIGQALARVIGAYGRLLAASHCLVPYLSGKRWPLVDLGFRMEQIAVRLVQMGLGSCFVGVLANEPAAVTHWELPPQARIGAVLIYGIPAQGTARAVNRLLRSAIGADNRVPLEQLFFVDGFQPAKPPDVLQPLLEAGRWAPSARNAQPWRWLWADDTLNMLITCHNSRYGGLADYALFDGGLSMANISLAMQAYGIQGTWELLGEENALPFSYPDELLPLARLTLH